VVDDNIFNIVTTELILDTEFNSIPCDSALNG